MTDYVVETENGSMYKVSQMGKGWKINMPQFKAWKPVAMLGKGRQPTQGEKIQSITDFKGALIWFDLEDKEHNIGKTSPVVKIYAEA